LSSAVFWRLGHELRGKIDPGQFEQKPRKKKKKKKHCMEADRTANSDAFTY